MNKYKEDIQHIRTMMERSSTFISLSGLSGVVAGVTALIGAYAVYALLVQYGIDYFDGKPNYYPWSLIKQLMIVCMITLGVSLVTAYWFTARKAKRNGQTLWNSTARRVLINMFIPLISGGLFCLILTYHNNFYLVAPAMLLFYGMALINTAKYTLPEIFWLGICEIILGLCATLWLGYGLLFWALGFGLFHIIYGLLMYNKYESA